MLVWLSGFPLSFALNDADEPVLWRIVFVGLSAVPDVEPVLLTMEMRLSALPIPRPRRARYSASFVEDAMRRGWRLPSVVARVLLTDGDPCSLDVGIRGLGWPAPEVMRGGQDSASKILYSFLFRVASASDMVNARHYLMLSITVGVRKGLMVKTSGMRGFGGCDGSVRPTVCLFGGSRSVVSTSGEEPEANKGYGRMANECNGEVEGRAAWDIYKLYLLMSTL